MELEHGKCVSGGMGANIDCPAAHNHFVCILEAKFQKVGQFVQLQVVTAATHGQQLKQLPVTAQKQCSFKVDRLSGHHVSKGSPLYGITHKTTLWADRTTTFINT